MLGEEAEGWNGKHERGEGLHKRSAEDCGKPLAPRQGGALSEAWFPYSRARARRIYQGRRCGQERGRYETYFRRWNNDAEALARVLKNSD
jgi:hypothetical protein